MRLTKPRESSAAKPSSFQRKRYREKFSLWPNAKALKQYLKVKIFESTDPAEILVNHLIKDLTLDIKVNIIFEKLKKNIYLLYSDKKLKISNLSTRVLWFGFCGLALTVWLLWICRSVLWLGSRSSGFVARSLWLGSRGSGFVVRCLWLGSHGLALGARLLGSLQYSGLWVACSRLLAGLYVATCFCVFDKYLICLTVLHNRRLDSCYMLSPCPT